MQISFYQLSYYVLLFNRNAEPVETVPFTGCLIIPDSLKLQLSRFGLNIVGIQRKGEYYLYGKGCLGEPSQPSPHIHLFVY